MPEYESLSSSGASLVRAGARTMWVSKDKGLGFRGFQVKYGDRNPGIWGLGLASVR